MGFSDNFFNKIQRKTNISKEEILNLASTINNGNMKDETTIRNLIDKLSKMTGKEVSKEQSDKIVNTIIKDNIPSNMEDML